MSLIIVSNRAPVKIIHDSGALNYQPAAGGLATGLKSYIDHQRSAGAETEILWIGWPGAAIQGVERTEASRELRTRFGVEALWLSGEEMERFYLGFCNKTIWPLFHYFPTYVEYDAANWEDYLSVNRAFADAVAGAAKPGDTIWIHDYHLMLVPAMLRRRLPAAEIGFFLHIPFPSNEVFRLLPQPWRERIIDGLLGADLVGFHTPEYTSHFIRSAEAILPISVGQDGMIRYRNRQLRAAAFPMGVEFSKFHDAVNLPEVETECRSLREHLGTSKIILSVDRQDYTKGILNRLAGFECFLEQHPEAKGTVTMLMVVVPSRVGVENYQAVKARIDKAVGRINGEFSRLGWVPIVYQYRELEFEELMALYVSSDVALITPLRDGMNLIAKEYIAARKEPSGVLILSEMAGAAAELKEAIIINPNFKEEIAQALASALEMLPDEQRRRMEALQEHVRQHDVVSWASSFLDFLASIKREQALLLAPALKGSALSRLIHAFRLARSRLLLLDYDGTLTPIVSDPATAVPSQTLLSTLARLTGIRRTEVAIVSGRDRATLERWFGALPVSLIAEHGVFVRRSSHRWIRGWRRAATPKWEQATQANRTWKPEVRTLMDALAAELSGTWVEEKEYSIAFHYRNATALDAGERARELVERLQTLASAYDVQVVAGKQIVEARVAAIDKGFATREWLTRGWRTPGFVLAIGDDTTDEDLFAAMPENAFTIKVGPHPSKARSRLESPSEVLELLQDLAAA